jgi:broad specificity phosphatase PhoE
MRKLILVKHSQPQIVADVPAKHWRLSAEGRRRCVALAARLATYDLGHIVASTESKATETAHLVASQLGMAYTMHAGLHEHERSTTGFLSSSAFHDAVTAFFACPNELVFGDETAEQARSRLTNAVEGMLRAHPSGNVAIVAHGTVISLFVAAHTNLDPFELWQQLGLPSFVVLALSPFELLDVVPTLHSA